MIGAKRDNELIAVEIKSFIGNSTIYDFHVAIGQFVNYYLALQDKEPQRTLFLAVPELTYYNFFTKNTIQKTLKHINAKIIVYNAVNQTIVEWKK